MHLRIKKNDFLLEVGAPYKTYIIIIKFSRCLMHQNERLHYTELFTYFKSCSLFFFFCVCFSFLPHIINPSFFFFIYFVFVFVFVFCFVSLSFPGKSRKEGKSRIKGDQRRPPLLNYHSRRTQELEILFIRNKDSWTRLSVTDERGK